MGTEELPTNFRKELMPAGHINEPQSLVQEKEMKLRFEKDVVRGDVPPYYLVPERQEETHKDFILPYNVGRCRVSWADNEWNFEYF